MRPLPQLPALAIADAVNEHLQHDSCLVVTAPPGAGKSTLLPLTILDGLKDGGKVLMLEPRRLAARQIAERMASLLGEEVGETVGYRIRFERRVSAKTRIEVLTEGILTRMLIEDPTLDGVSAVIFDEFHERSLASDVALCLTREAQQVIRPDLRIVIMSATIDTSALCQALGASLIESEGRMFPITDIRGDEIPLQPSLGQSVVDACASAVAHIIRMAHHEQSGDILAFLPGEAEIRRCAELLGDSLMPTRIYPLYGMLSSAEQQRAIAPSHEGERKVVLATPIAETSLTIEGVRVVVDSGLCRRLVFDPQNGLSHLETVRISDDMAQQRRGRAGRVAPGTCYQLWSLATQHQMPPCRQPEILEADLSATLLDVAAWGESDIMRLPWLTPPPTAKVMQARKLLLLLGAIDDHGQITPHGKRLAHLPCHPRIAQLLLMADDNDTLALASEMAALLDERDPLAAQAEHDADFDTRLSALQEARRSNHHLRIWDRIINSAEQYQRMAQKWIDRHGKKNDASHCSTGRLLAAAYPERIAQALPEGCGRFKLATGDIVQVDMQDPLSSHDWLAVAHVNVLPGGIGRIFLASPLSLAELRPLATRRDNLSWDNKQGRLMAQSEWRIGSLLVESRPLASNGDKDSASQLQLREMMTRTLCEAAQTYGTSMLSFDDAVGNLQRRVEAVASWHPELSLPDLSTEAVLASAHEWLPLYIGKATTTAELRKIDLTQALWGLLDYEQQQAVDRLAPTHIAVPTGSRIRVEYRQGAEQPILRVRLQECFGLTDTPRVDDGQRPILLELLSPGFKPVQLTQDLRSFWQSTYFEVRKELRRRYPKHAWPDNPLEAQPMRGVPRQR